MLQEIKSHNEVIRSIMELIQINKEFELGLPDYEALRNILMAELKKHRNEPNFDKFDWQITTNNNEAV